MRFFSFSASELKLWTLNSLFFGLFVSRSHFFVLSLCLCGVSAAFLRLFAHFRPFLQQLLPHVEASCRLLVSLLLGLEEKNLILFVMFSYLCISSLFGN